VRVVAPFAAGGPADIAAHDGSMAVRTARPAIRYRKPAGCRRQYRYRGGREVASERLHATPGR
jgi:hypothetical protein